MKIFAFVAASLILGAFLAPGLYQLGKGMAEVFAGKESNPVILWLADAAQRSDFPRFFSRAVMLAAVLLLFPLIAWLRLGRSSGRFRDTPWSLRLPEHLVVNDLGQPLQRNPQGWLQCSTGFILAAGLLLLSGWVMVQSGCFVWRDAAISTRGVPNRVPLETIDWLKAARKSLPPAVVVGVIEEILFRGVLLGIFLRALRPAPAMAMLSFLFAFVHFLEPPIGVVIDPESSNAGFQMLSKILGRFSDPMPMISSFMVLSAVGMVLAYSRYRTASLWLPIGLHAGWVFGEKLFKAATWPVPGLPRGVHWFVGETLKEGLLPLSVIVITGILVHTMTRVPEPVAEYRS